MTRPLFLSLIEAFRRRVSLRYRALVVVGRFVGIVVWKIPISVFFSTSVVGFQLMVDLLAVPLLATRAMAYLLHRTPGILISLER